MTRLHFDCSVGPNLNSSPEKAHLTKSSTSSLPVFLNNVCTLYFISGEVLQYTEAKVGIKIFISVEKKSMQ